MSIRVSRGPSEVQTLRLSIPDSQVKDEVAVVRMEQAILDKVAAVPESPLSRSRPRSR